MYYGPDGRRYTAPTTFVTKSEARAWLSLRHAEIIRKAWAPPESIAGPWLTFAGYAEGWLAQRALKDRTREHYRKLLDQHLLPAFGPTALAAITPESVRSWHAGFGDQDADAAGALLRAAAHHPGHRRHRRTDRGEPVLTSRGAGTTRRSLSIRPAVGGGAGQADRRRCPSGMRR